MTDEKLNLELLLQLPNLEPESRLRDAQDLCALCEALLFAHGDEILQLPEIHAMPHGLTGFLYRRGTEIITSERLYIQLERYVRLGMMPSSILTEATFRYGSYT